MFLGLYDADSAQTVASGACQMDVFTVTMGKKASQAHLYVEGSHGLQRLLSKLE